MGRLRMFTHICRAMPDGQHVCCRVHRHRHDTGTGDRADLMALLASGASRSAPPERAAASSRPPASASSHRGRGSCTRQCQHVRASNVICCRSGCGAGGPKQAGPQAAKVHLALIPTAVLFVPGASRSQKF